MSAGLLVAGSPFSAAQPFFDFAQFASPATFQRPAADAIDVLPDGRIIALSGANVFIETAVGSKTFPATPNATLAGLNLGSAAAFLRVSPDGSRIAVGNNGGPSFSDFRIGVYATADFSGQVFSGLPHYDARFFGNNELIISRGGATFADPSSVVALDVTQDPMSAVTRLLVSGIGGASAGVFVDAAGRLVTGNGFQNSGPSQTGDIRSFGPGEWQPGLSGGPAVNFETGGTLVARLLGAASLGFDSEGNLLVGGGEFNGQPDYAGIVRASRYLDTLAGMASPVTASEMVDLRQLFPQPVSVFSSHSWTWNPVLGEGYLTRFGESTTWVVVPEPVSVVLLAAGGAVLLRRRRLGRVCGV